MIMRSPRQWELGIYHTPAGRPAWYLAAAWPLKVVGVVSARLPPALAGTLRQNLRRRRSAHLLNQGHSSTSDMHCPLCQVSAADVRYKLQGEAVDTLGDFIGDVAAYLAVRCHRAIRTTPIRDVLGIRLPARITDRPLGKG